MRSGIARRGLAFASLCWLGACASDPDPSKYAKGMPAGGAAGAAAQAPGAGAAAATPAANSGSGFAGSGAYVVSGEWHGYAFTAASGGGSTIAPADFEARPAGRGLCASGNVGPAADYSGTALVGVNLAQEMATGSMPMAVVPMKNGVWVRVENKGGSPLRVQIQGPKGATDASDRWCAPLAGTSGFIPWSQFNTACWNNSGSAYAKQPIVAAMLLVPGGMTDAVRFDFCVEALGSADAAAPATPPPAATGSAAPPASPGSLSPGNGTGSGTITDKYGAVMVQRDGRSYYVQNNVWGDSTSQSLKYEGTTFEVTNQTGMNVSSGPNAMGPVSYPSVFIGSNYNRKTSNSNLPKQVSALGSVKTGWSHNAGSAVAGSYNAAYDVWFSTGAGGDAQAPSGGYLMVWYSKPAGIQPIGRPDPTPVTIPGVSGTWEVWLGQNGSRPCISYVRTEPITSLEFDLKAFIQEATTRPNAIKAEWYLSNVFAGFEIWSGGVGLKTTAFYAIVE